MSWLEAIFLRITNSLHTVKSGDGSSMIILDLQIGLPFQPQDLAEHQPLVLDLFGSRRPDEWLHVDHGGQDQHG